MPSVEQNVDQWDRDYDWSERGDEWSKPWGGAAAQWYGSLHPRVRSFLPSQAILEIAPGFGRWTEFLLPHCERYIGVDVSTSCVEACATRFANEPKAQFVVNDGSSLPMVEDASIDFAFSFDSLVHVDAPVIGRYLTELARVLRPTGAAFIHHSNYGAYPRTGHALESLPLQRLPASVQRTLDETRLRPNVHWRALGMSARSFVSMCEDAGLHCVGQELINWGGGLRLIDAMSIATPPGSPWDRDNRVVKNWLFRIEAGSIRRSAQALAAGR